MAKKIVKFAETKALQAFDGAIRTLNLHIQLVDRSLAIANNYVCKNPKENIALALRCSIETHPQLNVPCNKNDIGRIYTTSRKKIHEQAIVELYRIFTNYIRNIIEEFIHTDPYPLLQVVCENKDNKIEFKLKSDSFAKLIEFQIANNTDAIIVCGTTGEASTLTDEEQIEVVQFAVDKVKGRIPVIAGAGSNDTVHAISLCQESCRG